jgi:hypothetical protein
MPHLNLLCEHCIVFVGRLEAVELFWVRHCCCLCGDHRLPPAAGADCELRWSPARLCSSLLLAGEGCGGQGGLASLHLQRGSACRRALCNCQSDLHGCVLVTRRAESMRPAHDCCKAVMPKAMRG